MKIPKFKAKKVKEFFERLPKTLGERVLLTFLGLLFLSLIFCGVIFYKYNISAKKAAPQIQERPLQFEEKTYESVLKIWQEKEKKFKEASIKEYPDPFRID